MRRKKESVLVFEWDNEDLPLIVRQSREKHKQISRILDENPVILDMAHKDLVKLSEGEGKNKQGRNGDFTSETILRALILHAKSGDSFRETVIRIANSDFLQDFIRTRKKAVMDYTFLDRCFKAIRPETWKRINVLLVKQSVADGAVDPSIIRTDTTAIETNIHWPTDASLLWDTYRVAARLMRAGREIYPESCPYRFHEAKTKKLFLDITRFIGSKNKGRQRMVKKSYRKLIEQVGQIVEKSREFCNYAKMCGDLALLGISVELAEFLPSMATVVEQAKRARCNVTWNDIPDTGLSVIDILSVTPSSGDLTLGTGTFADALTAAMISNIFPLIDASTSTET